MNAFALPVGKSNLRIGANKKDLVHGSIITGLS
jgi:hypothetical protein